MLLALIFDVDGTLADTERDGHRIAFNRAFAEAALPWHWNVEQYGELLHVAGGQERLLHFMRGVVPEIPESRRTALASALHARKTEHYLSLIEAGAVSLRPGIARLLREVHAQGCLLAIATTTTRANVHALLEHTLPQALSWVAVIGAADDAALKKPDPGIYRFVLARLGLHPAECLAIEDSAAGLRAAMAAGLPTLVTVNDYSRGQDFSGALAVVNSLGEPEAPAQSMAGAMLKGSHVDLAQLREWHAASIANML